MAFYTLASTRALCASRHSFEVLGIRLGVYHAHPAEDHRSEIRKGVMSDPKLVLDFAKRNDVKIVDLRFTDLPGLWHHISYPAERLTEEPA